MQPDFETIDPDLITRIVLAAAPEQQQRWEVLLDRYKPEFNLLSDRPGISMWARGHRVEFDSKTLGWIWLLGFAAWHAFSLYGPHLFLRWLSKGPVSTDAMHGADVGSADARAAFEEVLYITRDLRDVDCLDESVGWPASVPARQADKTGFSVEQQAAFDLTMIAQAYVFLHEFQHVMFNRDGKRPAAPDEELACDKFARDFILGDVQAFADSSNSDKSRVLMKRAMGIALGAYIVCEFTPANGRQGDADYPPLADRVEALIAALPPADEDTFWDFAASLLIAVVLRQAPSASIPDADPKQLCSDLIGILRQLG